MELFSCGHGAEGVRTILNSILDYADNSRFDITELEVLPKINACYPFSQDIVLEHVGYPVCKIVGWFRREKFMLLEVMMGMMIDGGARCFSDTIKQFLQIPGFSPRKIGKVLSCIKVEWFLRNLIHGASSKISLCYH
jgi:hypothetical protein